jgi:hypothetical protein
VSRHRIGRSRTFRWKTPITVAGVLVVLAVAGWALIGGTGAGPVPKAAAGPPLPSSAPASPTAGASPSASPSPTRSPSRAPSPSRSATVPAPPPPAAGQSRGFYVTYYGAADNTPPGSREIAYATVHSQAGGTGTYRDPITFATDRTELPVGTIIYFAPLRRYFVMEDSCTECEEDWRGHGPDGGPRFPHIDLWAGTATDSGIGRCENSLTRDGQSTVLVGPPSNLPVTPGQLYDGRSCAKLQ